MWNSLLRHWILGAYLRVFICECVFVWVQAYFWDFWRVLSVAGLASKQNQNGGYAEIWKPGEIKLQGMIRFTSRNWEDSHIIHSGDVVAVKVHIRGLFTIYMFRMLNVGLSGQMTWEQVIEMAWRKMDRWNPNLSLAFHGTSKNVQWVKPSR